MKKGRSYLGIIIFAVLSTFYPTPILAQSTTDEATEVYLDFRHRGVINSMITAYYYNNQFYLPVGELFSLLQIDHRTEGLITRGKYAKHQVDYNISFPTNEIKLGYETYLIDQDDYILGELDNYLHPRVLNNIFDLDFTIDFNNLSLSLETNVELPAIASALRKQRRTIADRNRYSDERYPLRHGRERPFLDGGFIDYNFSGSYTPEQTVFNFNTNVGLQLYGGDFQGIIFGNHSKNYTNIATNNMRWRYRYVDNPYISSFTVGQSTTDGIARSSYTGIRISNDPIEPRRLFDEFEIQGNTIPESEVELYLNNTLIDFQQADELGNYRFLAPVSYGSSQLDINIFGPTGQIIEQSRRIQIPFTFQPEGVFNYQFNAGRLDNPIFGSVEREFTAQANGAYGLTNWLTAKAGIEYYRNYHQSLPTFTTTLSSRILHHYLLTLEAATEAYYRGAINVIYPNSASFNVDYTNFNSGIGLYNPSNDDQRVIASAFYPFSLFKKPFNLRVSTFSRIRENTSTTTFRMNASTRLGKLSLRFGYSDRFTDTINLFQPSNTAYLESSATYNFSRRRSLPSYLRGVFLRAQMRYFTTTNQIESADIVASQNILKKGRLQVTFGRNFSGAYNTLRLSLVIDFNKFRSSSTFNSSRNNFNTTQNIRGSVGYDSNYNNIIFTSRDQVGRSGAAIKLFVDNNANNIFDEEDDSIGENAVRINRSGATSIIKNDVLYYVQMQPYYFYNMEMNKGALRNPMLVPEVEKFGMITDPNRFKKIEIPFYMSGVVEGKVEREFTSGRIGGVAGLKLNLRQINGDYNEEIRTFSDGSFYSYEVPPGNYELKIDSTQLNILDSNAEPDSLLFQVAAVPEGDFVEGLYFLLKPRSVPEPKSEPLPEVDQEELEVITLEEGLCTYFLQLGSFRLEEGALSTVNKLPEEIEAFIVYNEKVDLYVVRVPAYPSLEQASAMVETLYENKFDDVAVLHHCSESSEGHRYDLQLAAFRNADAAQTFLNDYNHKYDFTAHLITDDEGTNFIILNSYTDLETAKNRKTAILQTYPKLEIYIAKRSYISTIQANYKYRLQLGIFDTENEAELYAARLKKEANIESHIVVGERGTIILFIDKPFSRWSNVIQTRRQISELPGFKNPIIHLSENE